MGGALGTGGAFVGAVLLGDGLAPAARGLAV